MSTRRKPSQVALYWSSVSPKRKARLERIYSRDPMRRWADETGVADRGLKLIVAMVREGEGLSTDPKTSRLVCLSEESQDHRD